LLVRVLNSRQVLLLLVQVVLVHLFLELDVLLVNSVDLLTEVLMLSLKPLDQLVLRFDLLKLGVVVVLLDLHLVPQVDELLGLWHDLDEGLLLGVAGCLLSSVLKEPWPICTEFGDTMSGLIPECGSTPSVLVSMTWTSWISLVMIGFLGELASAFLLALGRDM